MTCSVIFRNRNAFFFVPGFLGEVSLVMVGQSRIYIDCLQVHIGYKGPMLRERVFRLI